MTLKRMSDQLIDWLDEMRFGFDYEIEDSGDNHPVFRICFYTFTNKYTISAIPPDYLGCIATARKPNAGENWTRGRDLTDGGFTRATWNRILADIVAYEAVPIDTLHLKYRPENQAEKVGNP